MLIYIIMFLIVVILSKRMEKAQNKVSTYLYAIVLLAILSLVAGVRSIDLGWDASKYVVSTFYRLEHYGSIFKDFLDKSTVELGFSTYSYLLYKIYPNRNFLLFGYSFITTLFIMIYAYKEKDKLSISKVMIIYYLTLYLISYNIIRQSISVSIALVSFSCFKNKEIKKTILLCVLATLFHDSAIFMIPLYIMYQYLNQNQKTGSKKYKCMIMIAATILIGVIYEPLARITFEIGILPSKYYEYMLSYDRVDYNLSNIVINLFWVILAVIILKSNKDKTKKNNLLFEITILLISLLINIISIKLHPIYRIGYYYYYIGLFCFYPKINTYFKKNSTDDKIKNLLIISMLALWFFWITIIGNGYNIYPYYSEILTWLK